MKSFFTIILFAIITNVYSQTEFVKGYIVHSGGDTLRGFIHNSDNMWNTKSLVFKKSRKSNEEKISAGVISGFFMETSDELFIKRVVEIDKKPFDLNRLDNNATIKNETDTVFLRLLVSGKANLYGYYDFKRHFFVEKDNHIDELIFIKYYTYDNSGLKSLQKVEKYKSQLAELLQDCNSPRTFYFTQKFLTTTIKGYNQCTSNLGYSVSKEKIKLSFGALGGYAIDKLTYTGIANGDIDLQTGKIGQRTFDTHQNYLGGAFVDVYRKQRSKIRLNAELIIRPAYEHQATNGITYAYDTRMDYTIKVKYSTLNLGVKYNLLRKKIFGVTLKSNLSLASFSQTENYQIQTYNGVSKRIDPLANFHKSGLGFVGGIQFDVSSFFLQVRYDYVKLAELGLYNSSVVAGFKIR